MPRKTPPAQLEREINAVLKQPRVKSDKSTKTIDGYKVTILDHKQSLLRLPRSRRTARRRWRPSRS